MLVVVMAIVLLMGSSIFVIGKNVTPTNLLILGILAFGWVASLGLPVRRFRDIIGEDRDWLLAGLTISLFIPIVGLFTSLYALFAPGIPQEDKHSYAKTPHLTSDVGEDVSVEFIVIVGVIFVFALSMGTYAYAVLGPAAQASNELKSAIAVNQPHVDYAIAGLNLDQRKRLRDAINLLLMDSEADFTEVKKLKRALHLFNMLIGYIEDKQLTPREWEDWTLMVEHRDKMG